MVPDIFLDQPQEKLMIWYVNNEGPIKSVNACPQPGTCEREVPDTDPELVEFLARARTRKPRTDTVS